MESTPREVSWRALEYHHYERTIEWYVILGILVISLTIGAMILNNILLAFLIVIGGIIIALAATRPPRIITYSIGARGVKIGTEFHPMNTLVGFKIDEEHRHGPHVILESKKKFTPLIILPIPEDHIDDIDDMLSARLVHHDLEEPFYNILLEILRF